MKTIGNGSKVLWSGSWGRDFAKEAEIETIERTNKEHEKEGTEVDSVGFSENIGVYSGWEFPFVCTLTNGHWAYSYQIKPL